MTRKWRLWLAASLGGVVLAVALSLGLTLWVSDDKGQSSSAVDTASIQESVQVQTTSASGQPQPGGARERGHDKGQSANAVDISSIQEQVEVRRGSGEPQGGGPKVGGKVNEGIEYIIRYSSGKIKERQSVGGK